MYLLTAGFEDYVLVGVAALSCLGAAAVLGFFFWLER